MASAVNLPRESGEDADPAFSLAKPLPWEARRALDSLEWLGPVMLRSQQAQAGRRKGAASPGAQEASSPRLLSFPAWLVGTKLIDERKP